MTAWVERHRLQELLDAAFQDALDAQTETPLAHIAAYLTEAEAERRDAGGRGGASTS